MGAQDVFLTKLTPSGALSYSTFLGTSTFESASGVAVDQFGNAHIVGYTQSNQFPVLNAFQPTHGGGTCGTQQSQRNCYDAFVTKFNAAGSALIFSTYLGGSHDDISNWNGGGIALDGLGNIYVTGATSSTNFPLMNPFQSTHAPGASTTCGGCGELNDDVFVSKFDPTGSALIFSTYLGGMGDEREVDIAVSSANEAYVTGDLWGSPDFPTTPGAFMTSGGTTAASFVTKFSVTGDTLVYSTFLEGSTNAIAVNDAGNAYVTGDMGPVQFAKVVKLSASGDSLIYNFVLGGTESMFGDDLNDQYGTGIAVDASGNAYVHGDPGPGTSRPWPVLSNRTLRPTSVETISATTLS